MRSQGLDTPGAFGGRLLLPWLQRAVGDEAWMARSALCRDGTALDTRILHFRAEVPLLFRQEMVIGNDNTLYAALKSIPSIDLSWPDEEEQPQGQRGDGTASASSSGAGAGDGEGGLAGLDRRLAAKAQRAVAASMLRGVRGQIKGFATTVEEARSRSRPKHLGLPPAAVRGMRRR